LDTAVVAYDEELADRIRACLDGEHGVTEKRMFGGLAFLVDGSMAVSASGHGGLLLRVDPAQTDGLISEPNVTRAVMRGRAMDGWLRVTADAVARDDDLDRWVRLSVGYARSLSAS
jgi:TfoX/Sxy family transcriptional regulator of competence genes